jgi:hypothetical protein
MSALCLFISLILTGYLLLKYLDILRIFSGLFEQTLYTSFFFVFFKESLKTISHASLT